MLDRFPEHTRVGGHRFRRRHGFVLVSVLLVVLASGVVAGYLTFTGLTVVSNVQHAPLLPEPVGHEPGPQQAATAPGAPAKDTGGNPDPDGAAQNILLIGSDSRGAVQDGRSDVIVLAHVAADGESVQLIHFPRDLYVDIPGHGKDKINAAYAYGGAPLLVTTLQQLVHVRIDHVALIGFTGFEQMTDAVGGVDVYAEEPSNERTVIHRGWNHLDGKAALAFVRERHQLSLGDISRGRRQQAFIKALMLKGLKTNVLSHPLQLNRFLDAATANLTVDEGFSVRKMLGLALRLRDLDRKDITFVTAPWSGFGTTTWGASIVVMDQHRMRELSRALQDDRVRAYERSEGR